MDDTYGHGTVDTIAVVVFEDAEMSIDAASHAASLRDSVDDGGGINLEDAKVFNVFIASSLTSSLTSLNESITTDNPGNHASMCCCGC